MKFAILVYHVAVSVFFKYLISFFLHIIPVYLDIFHETIVEGWQERIRLLLKTAFITIKCKRGLFFVSAFLWKILTRSFFFEKYNLSLFSKICKNSGNVISCVCYIWIVYLIYFQSFVNFKFFGRIWRFVKSQITKVNRTDK